MSTIYLQQLQPQQPSHGLQAPQQALTLHNLPSIANLPRDADTNIGNYASGAAARRLQEFNGIPNLLGEIIIPTAQLCTLTGPNGETALHIAIERRDFSMFKLILFLAPDLISRYDCAGDTPLLQAAYMGELNMVRYLLNPGPLSSNYKANLSECNQDNLTALHLALMGGYREIASSLTEAGCDRNSRDRYGMTPGDRARFSSLYFDPTSFPDLYAFQVSDMFEGLAQDFASDEGLKSEGELQQIYDTYFSSQTTSNLTLEFV